MSVNLRLRFVRTVLVINQFLGKPYFKQLQQVQKEKVIKIIPKLFSHFGYPQYKLTHFILVILLFIITGDYAENNKSEDYQTFFLSSDLGPLVLTSWGQPTVVQSWYF